jgi:16S rRNA (guanine527-N7)-methyltransferase|tara:strand:+ start:1262 stop:1879 length:618 start_codon:yes stop_codon:yes gene_type:complete
MGEEEVKSILVKNLNFTQNNIKTLEIFHRQLLKHNKSHNLIGKSTEKNVWHRHILDSAQLVNFIEFKDGESLSDLGSGAGFPGIIIAIYNKNPLFHVKLYEKSPVKADFLEKMSKYAKINFKVIRENDLKKSKYSSTIVCRAFKKFPELMRISREIIKIPHKLIVLKGKSAQTEVNKALKEGKFEYRMENSITDKESKIIIVNAN